MRDYYSLINYLKFCEKTIISNSSIENATTINTHINTDLNNIVSNKKLPMFRKKVRKDKIYKILNKNKPKLYKMK